MDSDTIRTQGPRPQINNTVPQGNLQRPPGPPNNANINLSGPRPPPPNGQPPNLVRAPQPPPPQLRRTDSRAYLPPPQQQPLQQQLPQQQQQLQQRPLGPQQPAQILRPQGPPGAPGQQPQQQPFQQLRPQNPNSGPLLRGPPPQQQQQQLQNRPINPNSQQPPPINRPPFIRPQGIQPNFNPQQPNPANQGVFRPPVPGAPLARPPIPQQLANQSNQLRSQNSIEKIQRPPDSLNMSSENNISKDNPRPNSVLSNDDDDDVVMGRSITPKPPIQNQQYPVADSKQSISSRPQSAASDLQPRKSPSPENVVKQNDYKMYGAENLPKITENVTKNIVEEKKDAQRPPSVTFKDDIKSSSDTVKSPITLNSIINPSNSINKDLYERTSTPTSEKFRQSPVTRPPMERPSHLINGDDQKYKSSMRYKGDNDSGVDETTQGNERNEPGSLNSPLKSPSKIPGLSRPASATPSNKSQEKARSASRTRTLKTPDTPTEPIIKKVPMNKIQVGNAPSPNLKQVRSKIGSLDNAAHKPGGGNIKIETKKLEFKVTPRIEAKNDKYISKGGEKKITHTKLQWNAKSKIGSLENANHKPGGGDKKIESIKTEFKDNAKAKVGSKDNVKYVPGGGDVKIQTQKVDIKAQSKIGSLDNVKHRPGGGDKKIFDDKDYLKNVDHPIAPIQPSQSPVPPGAASGADENLNQQS